MVTIDTAGKRIDLHRLAREMTAGGIPHGELALMGTVLLTVDAAGVTTNDWPTGAVAVVDAHSPPPPLVNYAGSEVLASQERTTDDVVHEILRIPTEQRHVYVTELSMTAIDAVSGATKRASAVLTFKRLAAALAQVGSTVAGATMQDAVASSWRINAIPDGTDLVITVQGAAGRTIDWLLAGTIGRYAPGGLTASPSPVPPPPPDHVPPPPPPVLPDPLPPEPPPIV